MMILCRSCSYLPCPTGRRRSHGSRTNATSRLAALATGTEPDSEFKRDSPLVHSQESAEARLKCPAVGACRCD